MICSRKEGMLDQNDCSKLCMKYFVTRLSIHSTLKPESFNAG